MSGGISVRLRSAVAAMLAMLVLGAAFCGCDPVDKDYAVSSDETATVKDTAPKPVSDDVKRPDIMSDDMVMPRFVDISVFDEENYADIYLGKKFKFNVTYAGDEFTVPTKISDLEKAGWKLIDAGSFNPDSTVYARESVNAVFANEKGAQIKAVFFNSSNSSVKLEKCNIVKFRIENNFYTSPDNYNAFSVNGVNNMMAVTDIIDTLGTPSHFYGLSETEYYLDYFISEDDRRNGITVYINPVEDSVTAVEFSYYK